MAEDIAGPDELAAVAGEQPRVASDNLEIQRIDPNGDVLLKCFNHGSELTSFIVSSSILQLASPVFRCMLKPNFKEGMQLLEDKTVVINLDGDDPFLLGTILAILHCRGELINEYLKDLYPNKLARLALLCDKYDFKGVSALWATIWFERSERLVNTPEDYGFLLLAAYAFNDASRFREISGAAVRRLMPGFEKSWGNQELLELLPDRVQNAIAARREKTLEKIVEDIQNMELGLRERWQLQYTTSRMICHYCGRTHPQNAKQCHPCKNYELFPKYCTGETRISELFTFLRTQSLWPTTQIFGKYSVSGVISHILSISPAYHVCQANELCPLKAKFQTLGNSLKFFEEHGVVGFCLKCIKEDNDWNKDKKCTHVEEYSAPFG